MDTPVLIGFHGVRGVGKDTTVQFIKDWAAESDPALTVVRRGFADKMKWAYMRQWVPDCTMEWAIDFVDQYKNDRTAVVAGGWVVNPDGEPAIGNLFISPVIFRDHMDWFATESAREVYGDDFWISQLLPLRGTSSLAVATGWWGEFHTYLGPGRGAGVADICCVADVRVPNEMVRIRELGGVLVKVKRRDIEAKVNREYAEAGRDVHLFARSLPDEDFDFVLDNSDNNMTASRMRAEAMIGAIMEYSLSNLRRQGSKVVT